MKSANPGIVVAKLARLSIVPFRALGYRAFVIEPKRRTRRRFPPKSA